MTRDGHTFDPPVAYDVDDDQFWETVAKLRQLLESGHGGQRLKRLELDFSDGHVFRYTTFAKQHDLSK